MKKKQSVRRRKITSYKKLLATATPGPYQANSGCHGYLGQKDKEMTPYWLVQTNLVRNGPEATLCMIGLDVNGQPSTDHIYDGSDSPDPRFRDPYTITDAEHAANAALLAHSVNVLPIAREMLQYLYDALVKGNVLHRSHPTMRSMKITLRKINTVDVWVGD